MNSATKVLLVEDETTLAVIIRDTLKSQGFQVMTADNGEHGLQIFFRERPDVVVADVMMPNMDGYEMVRRIRSKDITTPILFLTALSETEDVVRGFESGANDYLRKPFGMLELIVRIKALVGRAFIPSKTSREEEPTKYVIGDYQLDTLKEHLLYAAVDTTTEIIPLSHRESEILRLLCRSKGEVVNNRDILLELWGDDSYFNTRSLHVFITKLRRKLSRDPSVRIINVRGIGYKLI
ncbi:MAG: response regulator transcription factor [Prevotella sp.]